MLKKILQKAVDRNKIKRLMRSSLRECVLELKNKISEQKKTIILQLFTTATSFMILIF